MTPNNNRESIPRETREQSQNQVIIRNYMKQQPLKKIINPGYIDQQKFKGNTRFLSMNVHSLCLQNNEKIDHIMNKCKTLEIDAIFLTESNIKWTIHNKERVINKFKQMGRST